MEQELEFNQENNSQAQGNREEYRKPAYTKNYSSEGHTPRPRFRTQQGAYGERPRFNPNREQGGFRPEGFGAGLQHDNDGEQHSNYQQGPRFNNGGGYQRRGGYQQRGYRPQYNQEEGGFQPRGGYHSRGGYRPQYNQEEGGYQQRGGYQPRGGFRPRFNQEGEEGGYQQRGGYQPRGSYQQRGGYNQGGYQQRGGYQRGGYNQGGYGPRRQRTADYDPNAKYSHKKRIEYSEAHIDPNAPIRLNKYLANAGVCSRREADDFITAGLVTVNGEIVTELGTKVLRSDKVVFHDQPVSIEKKVYVLLNKPKDYVTTSDDPQQRKIVMDLVKDACSERIYPVGRLDRNTTGVLLLTNDGELASKLTHPKFLKKKVYHVFLDKNVTAHDLQQIAEGIQLEDGEIHADAVEYASPTDKKQVGIEIHSGKNRIVRRIFESLGYKVTKLDRVQFAGLTKKNLRRGDWRFLTEKEVDMLRMGAFE